MFRKYLKYFVTGEVWLNKKEKVIPVKKDTPKDIQVEIKAKESKNITAPFGYIDCKLENISVEALHQKYNILLKSITIENRLFVSSIVLLNEPKEFDCFADGENSLIEIKEIDDNLLAVRVREKNGAGEKFYIRGGKIEIKL